VPDYRLALAEFFRCLCPGGEVIISVPFLLGASATLTRATIDASGGVTHLLPPEIHGDPLDPAGALCFYHFGWDFLDALAAAGFQDAGISLYGDARLGYLGGHRFIITARKAGALGRFRSFLEPLWRRFAGSGLFAGLAITARRDIGRPAPRPVGPPVLARQFSRLTPAFRGATVSRCRRASTP